MVLVHQSDKCADELALYFLSRICNNHIAIICKDKVYYSHTTPPQDSQPMDCDFMFVYLGKNNFREVKVQMPSFTQHLQTKIHKPPSDNEWEPS